MITVGFLIKIEITKTTLGLGSVFHQLLTSEKILLFKHLKKNFYFYFGCIVS